MTAAAGLARLTALLRMVPKAVLPHREQQAAAALGRLANALEAITRRTDPEFVVLANELKGLHASAMELSADTQANAASLRDALEQVKLSGGRELALRAMEELRSRSRETSENLASLGRVAGALGELRHKGQAMERLATLLAVSRYSLAVECGRTEERREAFYEFVGVLEELGNQVRLLGAQISDEAAGVRLEFDRLIDNIGAGQAELTRLEGRSESAARAACDEVQRLLDSAWTTLAGSEGLTSAIGQHAGEASYYLQFGDIVRQKLEHVLAALQDAAAVAAGRPARSREAAIGRILAVQSAQMDTVEAEVRSAGEKLEITFAGLAQDTERLATGMRRFGLAEEKADGGREAFEYAETCLSDLLKLGSESAALGREAGAMSDRARSASADFARYLEQVQALNHRMHLQALNAIVKTAHLGGEGGTLGVLSLYVHDIARQSDEIATATTVVLERIEAHSRCSAGKNTARAGASDELRRGLDKLRRVHQDLCAATESAVRLAARQQQRLAQARQRLCFLAELCSAVNSISAELKSLGRSFPAETAVDGAGPGLDSMARRYTMASELDVHHRLLGADNACGDPLPPAEPAVAAAGDLGDNVELF